MSTETPATERGRWYPCPPPALDGEDADAYTNRITGADRTGREPYDHMRYRECSMGYHTTCSDPAGTSCGCPCHHDHPPALISPAAMTLAGVYCMPPVSAQHVMNIAVQSLAAAAHGRSDGASAVREALRLIYLSEISDDFVTDVLAILRDVSGSAADSTEEDWTAL
jgi:hypothetical protein